jgi:DNA polymerase-1
MHLLANMGFNLAGDCEDILTMDTLVDDTRAHGLKEQNWLAYEAKWGDFKQLFLDPAIVSGVLGMDATVLREFKKMGVGDKLLHVYDQAPHMVVEYASCDAFFTYMRWDDLTKELASEELPVHVAPGFSTLLNYYTVIEKPLTKCLFDMERTGVNIDLDYVEKIDIPVREGIRGLKQDLNNLAGKQVNPDSPDQIRWILFEEKNFGLKAARYTKPKSGEPKASTDAKTLEILVDRLDPSHTASKFVVKLQDYRKLSTLHKTFIKGIKKHLGDDGKLHSNIKQHVARTGRFSSADPNLQNIPRPATDPYKIRGAFIPSPDMWLIDKDYPQIEFRVAAVNADEQKMLASIHKGWDVHNANAVNMFNIDYGELAAAQKKKKEDLTKDEAALLIIRQQAKTTGLATLFGEGARKMAAQLGIDVNSAYRLKDQFFNAYPKIEENIAFMHEYGHEFETTFTMLGRVRRLHKINSDRSFLVSEEERQAYNTHVQGSAAELIKLAMLRIHSCKALKELGGRLILTVHDELLMEAPKDTAADVADLMHDYMAHPLHWGPLDITYPVPIDPDGEIGYRWSECH